MAAHAAINAMLTISIINDASALMSGVTPSLT